MTEKDEKIATLAELCVATRILSNLQHKHLGSGLQSKLIEALKTLRACEIALEKSAWG